MDSDHAALLTSWQLAKRWKTAFIMSAYLTSLTRAFTLKYVAVSGSALLVHDYFLTMSSEVEYIWKTRWSAVKAGFLLNRYGNLAGQTVITLQETGYFGPPSRAFCYSFGLYYTLFMFFSSESVRFAVAMRAWAIWGCSYRVTVCLASLYLLYLGAVIGTASYFWHHGGSLPPVGGICVAEVNQNAWLLWLAGLVVDTIVLIMVLHNLRKYILRYRCFPAPPFIRLIIRDAIAFYAATAFNSGFTIICWTVFREDPRVFLQLVFSFPVLTITGQRLVLNLRRLRAQPCSSSHDASRMVQRQIAALDDEWWRPTDESAPGRSTDIALEPMERLAVGRRSGFVEDEG